MVVRSVEVNGKYTHTHTHTHTIPFLVAVPAKGCPPVHHYFKKGKVNQSRYRPEVPRGFQEVKVPRFHDNFTGWW